MMSPEDALAWWKLAREMGQIAVAAGAVGSAYWLGSKVLDSFYSKMREWTQERDVVHEANLTKIVDGHVRAMDRLATAVESVEAANESCVEAQRKIAEIQQRVEVELAKRTAG